MAVVHLPALFNLYFFDTHTNIRTLCFFPPHVDILPNLRCCCSCRPRICRLETIVKLKDKMCSFICDVTNQTNCSQNNVKVPQNCARASCLVALSL